MLSVRLTRAIRRSAFSIQQSCTNASIQTRQFHPSTSRLAITTVNVPSMGDSISEGTLVQISKAAGEMVHADEVVAVLETDKVSVDVMSPIAGTVVEHFVQLEENVEVGKPLFSVDDSRAPKKSTSASSANKTAAASTTSSPAEPVTPAPAAADSSSKPSGGRVPLIRFLGKRSLLKPLSTPETTSEVSPASLSMAAVELSGPGVLPFTHTKKLPLSKAEISAINSGVAFL